MMKEALLYEKLANNSRVTRTELPARTAYGSFLDNL